MTTDSHQIRDMVRERYGAIAQGSVSSCCAPSPSPSSSSCCGETPSPEDLARKMGYGANDLEALGNLGLGCGNPQAIASMKPGEVVLDLGAGAGFDCFLAARQVGETGRVIGVDMTHDMLARARANAASLGMANVEFRLGEIENLPVADNSADVIISNCVINLSPEKKRVFAEAFRVLKPGGRIAVSDVVLLRPLPPGIAEEVALYTGCIAGAALAADIDAWLAEAGFTAIAVVPKAKSRDLIEEWAPGRNMGDYVVSADIVAVKPDAIP